MNGKFQEIHLNRQYNSALGNGAARRPDIMALDRNGRVHAIEVASKTDVKPGKLPTLTSRNTSVIQALPPGRQGQVLVFDHPYNASGIHGRLGAFEQGEEDMALKEVVASDGFLVLYECHLSFSDAVTLGLGWFSGLGLDPNEMACGHSGSPEGSPTKVKWIKKAAQFDSLIEQGSVDYIVVAHVANKDPRAHVTFYFGHDSIHPDFNRLIIAWRQDQLPDFNIEGLVQLVEKIGATARIPYGFATRLPLTQVNQYEYADAQATFPSFLAYENPALWKVEVPTYLKEAASLRRYLSGMLRLVYEVNFVTDQHLSKVIGDLELRKWIASDPSRGKLQKLGENLWAWSVGKEYLVAVNAACASAGLLIAWKDFAVGESKSKPRLPDSSRCGVESRDLKTSKRSTTC